MSENIEKLLDTKRLTAIGAVGVVASVFLILAADQSFSDVFQYLWGLVQEHYRMKAEMCPMCM